jgi:plastocyanin
MRTITLVILALALSAGASVAVTEIEIRDLAFVPANAVIMRGENVKWTNLDQVIHTSTSDTAKWDSGDLTHGKSFEFRFDTTGTFKYHCSYHVTMKGTIRVTETPVEPVSFGRVKALFR